MTTTYRLQYNGETLTGTSESIAREILAANGQQDPHPALLSDTLREVEYFGTQVEEEPTTETEDDVWEVVKDQYEVPCDHYACDHIHRHLYNEYYDTPQLVEVYNLKGERLPSRWEARYHVKTVTQWLVLHNGERVGEARSTKREAQVEASRKPTV